MRWFERVDETCIEVNSSEMMDETERTVVSWNEDKEGDEQLIQGSVLKDSGWAVIFT